MIRTKFCGITNVEDAVAASRAGANAIGLVFDPNSPQCIAVKTAKQIIANLDPFMNIVAVFENPLEKDVRTVIRHIPLDLLQFNGNESAEFCEQFNKPYMKLIRVSMRSELQATLDEYTSARAIIIDTTTIGEKKFDWSLVPRNFKQAVILSGPLDPNNLELALNMVTPYGVDFLNAVYSRSMLKNFAVMRKLIRRVVEAS